MSETLDAQQLLGIKKREKRAFFARYGVRAVEELYKRKFFALFDNRCFRCGAYEAPTWVWAPRLLCMDHHIPFRRGGRFEAGNLVSLCRPCNTQKRDKDPAVFYPPALLQRLQPLLNAEAALFEFSWDEDKWRADPPAYLAAVGVPADQIHATFHDEYFHGYIHPEDVAPQMWGITMSCPDIDALLETIECKALPKDTT